MLHLLCFLMFPLNISSLLCPTVCIYNENRKKKITKPEVILWCLYCANSQESHPSLQSSGATKAIPAANERTGKELLLQSTTVNQTPRAQNCTLIVTRFNQQSHIVWLQYLFKKKKRSLLNVLSQKREQRYQASIHHNRLHPFTHIDNSYLTVQTSISLITAGFVPLKSPPAPGIWKQPCVATTGSRKKLLLLTQAPKRILPMLNIYL